MSECPKCKASDCVGFNPKNRKLMCHSCLHEWNDAPMTDRRAAEKLRFHADAFGAISLTGHLFRQAADELDRLAGEVERARIEGMEEALRNVWQCYTGNHPAYGVGPDWDKALDGCCKLIEADIAKLKAGGRTGAG